MLATATLAGAGSAHLLAPVLSRRELLFGDFTQGHFAWQLDDVERLLEPIPARGRQRLWEWSQP